MKVASVFFSRKEAIEAEHSETINLGRNLEAASALVVVVVVVYLTTLFQHLRLYSVEASALDPLFRKLRFLTSERPGDVCEKAQTEVESVTQYKDTNYQKNKSGEKSHSATPVKKRKLLHDSDDGDDDDENPPTFEEREVTRFKNCEQMSIGPSCDGKTMQKLLGDALAKSVPRERLFSTAGADVAKNCSCLTGGHVNDLLFLSGFFKGN
jgi:hypothetical protein